MKPEISDAQRLVNYSSRYIFNRYDSANEAIITPKKDIEDKGLIERIEELEQDLVQVRAHLLFLEKRVNEHLDSRPKSLKTSGKL
jgi:hypothetical protein